LSDSLDLLTRVADEDRKSVEYRLHTLVLEIGGRVHARLAQLHINQAELARRMQVSRPMVTKLLTGESNFQLRTLLRLADALDMELTVDLAPEGFRLPRFYVSRIADSLESYGSGTTLGQGSAQSVLVSHKAEIVSASGTRNAAEYSIPYSAEVA